MLDLYPRRSWQTLRTIPKIGIFCDKCIAFNQMPSPKKEEQKLLCQSKIFSEFLMSLLF